MKRLNSYYQLKISMIINLKRNGSILMCSRKLEIRKETGD